MPHMEFSFEEYRITITVHAPDTAPRSAIIWSEKPFPVHAIGDMSKGVEYVIVYTDSRFDEGPYQALLFLVRDHRGVQVCFFINEKGHGSGFHGGWYNFEASCNTVVEARQVYEFHLKFSCLGSRGVQRDVQLRGQVHAGDGGFDLCQSGHPLVIELASFDQQHVRFVKGRSVVMAI
jgi:hypothetical protein